MISFNRAQSFTKHFEKMHLGNQNYRFIPPTKVSKVSIVTFLNYFPNIFKMLGLIVIKDIM